MLDGRYRETQEEPYGPILAGSSPNGSRVICPSRGADAACEQTSSTELRATFTSLNGKRQAMKVVAIFAVFLAMAGLRTAVATEVVEFRSAGTVLHGLLYKPAGSGPFPALLYDHSAGANHEEFDVIGPRFASHGWVMFVTLSTRPGPQCGCR